MWLTPPQPLSLSLNYLFGETSLVPSEIPTLRAPLILFLATLFISLVLTTISNYLAYLSVYFIVYPLQTLIIVDNFYRVPAMCQAMVFNAS